MAITGRKAIFFSASALLIVAIILATVGQQATQRDSEPELIRIGDISRDITLLEANTLPKILQAKSYNALATMARHAQGSPYNSISGIQGDFQNCVVYDICPGTPTGTQPTQFTQLAALYGQTQQYSTSNFQLQSVQIQERGPDQVLVTGTFLIQLQEASGAASYTTTKTISTAVPIDGLLDPYASNIIGQNRYVQFPPSGNWGSLTPPGGGWTVSTNPDTDRAVQSALRGYYQPDTRGPSYLQRLTTNPQPSPMGIHSLVPVQSTTLMSVDYAMTPPPNSCLIYIDIPSDTRRVQFTQPYANMYRLLSDPTYVSSGLVRRGANCP